MYKPHSYKILLIDNSIVKVFASWHGGYLEADSWRMNSGTQRIEYDEGHYYFHGFSGSVYELRKDSGKLSSYASLIYDKVIAQENVVEISLEDAIKFLEENK